MNSKEFKQKSVDIVKEVERSKDIQDTRILDIIPDMLSCVKLDKGSLVKYLNAALNSSGKNPFNALIGIMGLRIMNVNNTISIIDDELSKNEYSSKNSDLMLKIDSADLKKTVDNMADLLSSMEQNSREDHQKGIARYNELYSDFDKKEASYTQLLKEYKYQQKAVAERIRYMLSLCGKEESNPIKEQLSGLLEDLDMEAYWSSESTSMSEAAMFTVLKCDEPDKRKTQPCIAQNGEIIAKGTKFVKVLECDEPNKQSTQSSTEQKEENIAKQNGEGIAEETKFVSE